jgi:hypothetical protein
MKRERRKPTRAEWKRITSARPVVRRVVERGDSTRPEKARTSARIGGAA